MHNIIFSRKKKYVCLPKLKFSDPLPETHLFFYLALVLTCQLFYTVFLDEFWLSKRWLTIHNGKLYQTSQKYEKYMQEKEIIYKPGHEISNNVVFATSKVSDQPVHGRSLI